MRHSSSRALGAAFLLSLFSLSPGFADEVVLQGGSELRGVVLQESDATVQVLLPAGDTITLRRSDVKTVTRAPSDAAAARHMRFINKSSKEGLAPGLHIAITSYVHPEGKARVDLVGAAHIAEESFYRDVQRTLEDATVVLFEGVKPKDVDMHTLLRSKSTEPNPIRDLQMKMAKWFGLAFQLDVINYNRPHFVHADMTAEQFTGQPSDSIESPKEGETTSPKTGETVPSKEDEPKPSPAAKVMGQGTELANIVKLAGPALDKMIGDGTKGGPMRAMFKGMFARVMGTADVHKIMNTAMPDTADLLLRQRNDIVFERLKEQIAKLRARDTIAVFYGAAHLPGIENDLITKLGYKRAGARWISAWDTTK